MRRRRARMHKQKEEAVSFIRHNSVAVAGEPPVTVVGEFRATVHPYDPRIASGVDDRLGLQGLDRVYTVIFNFVLPEEITEDLLLLRHKNLKDGETVTAFSQNTATWRILTIDPGLQNTRVVCNEGN